MDQKNQQTHSDDKTFTFSHEEIVIHQRYEVLSIANDLLIGIWFTAGSFCFFFKPPVMHIGVWLFVLGSIQLLIRPVIRLRRRVRIKRAPASSQDF